METITETVDVAATAPLAAVAAAGSGPARGAAIAWIKHLGQFTPADEVWRDARDARVSLLVHPAYARIEIDPSVPVLPQVATLDRTVQLYFFSFAWVTLLAGANRASAIGLLHRCARESELGVIGKSGDMMWDDHAVAERAATIVELLREDEAPLDAGVRGDLLLHLETVYAILGDYLQSDRWASSNHRLFHFTARLIVEACYGDGTRATDTVEGLLAFASELMDPVTGVAAEQSIAYAKLDVVFVRLIARTLAALGFSTAAARLREHGSKCDVHLAHLAYPDGSIVAAGDTVIALNAPSGPAARAPGRPADVAPAEPLGPNLDRLGFVRLRSGDDAIHAVVLTHCAEGGHGHYSPGHLDVWMRGVGRVLTDSGGPYRYGDPLRFSWFRAPVGHNCIAVAGSNELALLESGVDVADGRSRLAARFRFPELGHVRNVSLDGGLTVVDRIETTAGWAGRWILSFHFFPGLEVVPTAREDEVRRGFEVLKSGEPVLRVLMAVPPGCTVASSHTPRCIGHGKHVPAPSIVIEGDAAADIRTEIGAGAA